MDFTFEALGDSVGLNLNCGFLGGGIAFTAANLFGFFFSGGVQVFFSGGSSDIGSKIDCKTEGLWCFARPLFFNEDGIWQPDTIVDVLNCADG